MSRTELKQGEPWDEKGVWWGISLFPSSRRSAIVSCPDCGESASLSGHRIGDNGDVTPSLLCPHQCGFHEHVTLVGWRPAP